MQLRVIKRLQKVKILTIYILCLKVSNLFLFVGTIGDSDLKASIILVSDLAMGDSKI